MSLTGKVASSAWTRLATGEVAECWRMRAVYRATARCMRSPPPCTTIVSWSGWNASELVPLATDLGAGHGVKSCPDQVGRGMGAERWGQVVPSHALKTRSSLAA